MDRDLASIQEVRNLLGAAKAAQKTLAGYNQQQVDALVEAVATACQSQVEPLAQMAVEETGFGNVADKVQKNLLACHTVYAYIQDMKTVGVIARDDALQVENIAVPVGVIAAVIPSTNPTSTVMYKALISLKAGNAMVASPHPAAKKCIAKTVEIIRDAIQKAGAPVDLVSAISDPTLQAATELMRHQDTSLILATGGPAMVKAAYSSGKPALGVGAGNGPAYIESTADVPAAITHIIQSKTFDNGTICASEQSLMVEAAMQKEVLDEAVRQGMYQMNEEESGRVAAILMRPNGSMNPGIVGRTAEQIAQMAHMGVPPGTKVLLSCVQTEISERNPYAREKLCPVLGLFIVQDWKEACERCAALLKNEGMGHTMVIHSQNQAVIRQFAAQKPVMRLLVNTPGAQGGTGITTHLAPALTLGCGAMGGTATSDNITPLHLLNIRRLAFGVKAVPPKMQPQRQPAKTDQILPAEIDSIVKEVLARLSQNK